MYAIQSAMGLSRKSLSVNLVRHGRINNQLRGGWDGRFSSQKEMFFAESESGVIL
jgi:hypothetical protein